MEVFDGSVHDVVMIRKIVVKGSGTGELAGLRGDGGFTAQLGQHGSVWLDYSLG